jgi:hypothetical protein
MREVVTDEFGASYVGWMGQHGKYPVYGTKLMDVIFGNKLILHICVCFTNIIRYDLASVDRSPLLPSATKKQVEGATMNYIHRFNQRFNRAKTPIADDKDGSYKRDSESSEDDDPRKQNGNHSESSEDEVPGSRTKIRVKMRVLPKTTEVMIQMISLNLLFNPMLNYICRGKHTGFGECN